MKLKKENKRIVEATLEYLGFKVRDRVTGFKGVVTSVSFDLYGCLQAVVSPEANVEKGEYVQGCWMDLNRLEVTDTKRVMEVPQWKMPQEANGPAEKPPM